MIEVIVTFPTPDGSREISLEGGRLSFGRGSDVDHRFEDDGLSRLHATIYREGERVWIVDENSSNGTFVNGEPVNPSGTPLRNGDSIRIGNRTVLNVHIREVNQPAVAAPSAGPIGAAETVSVSASPMSLVPIALIAFALLIMSVSAVLIGFKVFGSSGGRDVVQHSDDPDIIDTLPERTATPTSSRTSDTPGAGNTDPDDDDLDIPGPGNTSGPANSVPSKPYLTMSDAERRQYIGEKAMRMAQVIGNRGSDQIPAEAVDKIKSFTDAYAKRINVRPLGGCRFGDNLQATYERASKNAPFIVRAFNEKGIDPRIGLYLAMIESEHCVCLQSPTGPLGMFQFTKATGEMHGLKTVRGASPSNPDERCEPEPSARAAASYMKALTSRYGTGPSSVPLAIGSYNSGEGGLSSNLVKALESNSGLPRDFWTLISMGDILSKQFQSENFKYVPKFFAAAIVGENPGDFGLKLQPLSTYSK